MFHDSKFSRPVDRLGQFERMIREFDRDEIELAVEILIARLDAQDGDPDLEEVGDLEPDDDAQGDIAWIETHGQGGAVMAMLGFGGWIPQEDDEEGDDSGGNIEDQGEEGSWPENDEKRHSGVHAYRDDDREPADRSLMLRQRDRLRLARCRPRRWGEF
jgi:hypothetical protein